MINRCAVLTNPQRNPALEAENDLKLNRAAWYSIPVHRDPHGALIEKHQGKKTFITCGRYAFCNLSFHHFTARLWNGYFCILSGICFMLPVILIVAFQPGKVSIKGHSSRQQHAENFLNYGFT